jgi:hypothetical protein
VVACGSATAWEHGSIWMVTLEIFGTEWKIPWRTLSAISWLQRREVAIDDNVGLGLEPMADPADADARYLLNPWLLSGSLDGIGMRSRQEPFPEKEKGRLRRSPAPQNRVSTHGKAAPASPGIDSETRTSKPPIRDGHECHVLARPAHLLSKNRGRAECVCDSSLRMAAVRNPEQQSNGTSGHCSRRDSQSGVTRYRVAKD